jgi:hypothetical protein
MLTLREACAPGANLAAFRFGLVYFQCTVATPSGHLQQSRFAFCIRRSIRTLVVIQAEPKVPRFVRKSHRSRRLLAGLHKPACWSGKRPVGFNGAALGQSLRRPYNDSTNGAVKNPYIDEI